LPGIIGCGGESDFGQGDHFAHLHQAQAFADLQVDDEPFDVHDPYREDCRVCHILWCSPHVIGWCGSTFNDIDVAARCRYAAASILSLTEILSRWYLFLDLGPCYSEDSFECHNLFYTAS